MEKTFVTILNGEQHQKKDCVKINDIYYLITDPIIRFDNRLKIYVLKNKIDVEQGVIKIDSNFNPIFGAFSIPLDFNKEDLIYLNYKGKLFICLNETILKEVIDKNIWIERLSEGVFYRRTDLPVKEFNNILSCNEEYKKSLAYNSGNSIKEATKNFKKLYTDVIYNKFLESYPQITKNYSFGLEFETVKGDIPSRLTKKLGLIPLRDGSIDGIEFVTIPHAGKLGVQALLDSLTELKKRTTYDKNCSLHFHIGNLPRTEEFFCAVTKVLLAIQDNVYEMFPFCLRGGLGLKKKDYTAPLPAVQILSKMPNVIDKSNIKEGFKPIFDFLSMGHRYEDYDNNLANVKNHPSDPRGESKWYVKSRYRWVNMIPLLFGNKKTIEFRIHTPTYNEDKVINFLILCLSIVDFAKRNTTRINNGSLDIISYSRFDNLIYSYLGQFGDKYNDLSDKICNYFNLRLKHQRKTFLTGDFYANEDDFKHFQKNYSLLKKRSSILTESLAKKLNFMNFYDSNEKSFKDKIFKTVYTSRNLDPISTRSLTPVGVVTSNYRQLYSNSIEEITNQLNEEVRERNNEN